MKIVFILSALVALAASAFMGIRAAGGLESEAAPGLLAMAVILAVGSAAIGKAVALRAYALAICIGVGLVVGEFGAIISTAQRVASAAAAHRAPAVAVEAQRAAAVARLEAAETALHKVNDARRDQAALPGCKAECSKMLASAVTDATGERDKARDALAKVPASTRSATPLADVTGWPQWLIDLAEALCLSFALNIPASALLALGVRMGEAQVASVLSAAEAAQPAPADAVPVVDVIATPLTAIAAPLARIETPMPATIEPPAKPSPARVTPAAIDTPAEAEARAFVTARVVSDHRGRVTPPDLCTAYLAWVAKLGRQPLPLDIAGRAILHELPRIGAVLGKTEIKGVRLA